MRIVRRPDVFDSPWREAMHAQFRRCVEFFFPAVHADIDWEEGYLSLDTELRQIAGPIPAAPLRSDSLFQVKRRSGRKQLALFHAEVQTTRDFRLAERLFRYNYRSFDARSLEVASFAILGDQSPTWRPNRYGWSVWGCEVGIRFPVVKLIDWAGREEELEASDNPFAWMTLAFLATRSTQDDALRRRQWKLRIVRRLYENNYSAEEVRQLFRPIDWMMALEESQAIIFKSELEELEAEKGMQYVTSVERLARAEGRQEGIAALLATQLAQRFGQVPEWAAQRLRAATAESLEAWGRRIFEVRSLEDLFA